MKTWLKRATPRRGTRLCRIDDVGEPVELKRCLQRVVSSVAVQHARDEVAGKVVALEHFVAFKTDVRVRQQGRQNPIRQIAQNRFGFHGGTPGIPVAATVQVLQRAAKRPIQVVGRTAAVEFPHTNAGIVDLVGQSYVDGAVPALRVTHDRHIGGKRGGYPIWISA